jgi:glycosyltransferase involved in cell wall biosynthesis
MACMSAAANRTALKESYPLVSVVIPVYNAAKYICETLDSVFAQTVHGYELILVNDGSPDSDRLEQVLQPYFSRIIYLKQDNKGVSAARNAGIRAARGTFYAQLDADDLWEPEYLATQLEYLKRNPMIDLVYPNALIFNDDSDVVVEFMKVSPSQDEPTFERLVKQQCTVMTSITARMEAIKRAGMFDESLPTCEDFDLWLRLIKQGGRIGYHREILVRYRRRLHSLSSDRAWMESNLLRVLEKAKGTLQLTPAELSAVQQEAVRHRARLHVLQGKRALARGETAIAAQLFSEANSYYRSRKLSLALGALRYWPGLLNLALGIQRRWFSRSDRHILTGLE